MAEKERVGRGLTGKRVHSAGFMARLDSSLPQWNPGGVELTQKDATTWTITLTGTESTQLEYKYTLGAWDFVEKETIAAQLATCRHWTL